MSPAWLGCSGDSLTVTEGTCGENSAGTGTRENGRVYPGTAACNNLWIIAWAPSNPDCRIIEWFGVEETFKGHIAQLPYSDRDQSLILAMLMNSGLLIRSVTIFML